MPDAEVAVLCGRNKKLFESLSGVKNIRPYEYTETVDVFMDAADVLLTKPGGITSSEALSKRVPIVFTCPIPGGEDRNAAFISSLGAAVSAKSVNEAAEAAQRLAEDYDATRHMIDEQNGHFDRENSAKIAEFLIGMNRIKIEQTA
jgi:processive 1,2-diacylglycerol beta-glucosyltransferase